jgi:hypothetical protein
MAHAAWEEVGVYRHHGSEVAVMQYGSQGMCLPCARHVSRHCMYVAPSQGADPLLKLSLA